ncbi:hypothetical protein [Parvibaculum sp.]|uniref:hypothetical protein n=1 Tax=Parvibaculum sp. TaxID=2024848 RepID=UPI00391CDF4C
MTSQQDIEAALNELCEEWNKAESAIKLAEQVNGEIVNPAIYELRYAGRRVVEALPKREKDRDTAKKLLDDAHFDCCRARHDAIDAATSKMTADLRIAIDRIGADVVLDKFRDLPKLLAELSKVRKLIATSRENRNDRDAIYATIQDNNLVDIVRMFDEFQASETVLKAAAARIRISRFISYGFGVLGITLTIVFGILSLA